MKVRLWRRPIKHCSIHQFRNHYGKPPGNFIKHNMLFKTDVFEQEYFSINKYYTVQKFQSYLKLWKILLPLRITSTNPFLDSESAKHLLNYPSLNTQHVPSQFHRALQGVLILSTRSRLTFVNASESGEVFGHGSFFSSKAGGGLHLCCHSNTAELLPLKGKQRPSEVLGGRHQEPYRGCFPPQFSPWQL